jgi:hypothetical protein
MNYEGLPELTDYQCASVLKVVSYASYLKCIKIFLLGYNVFYL